MMTGKERVLGALRGQPTDRLCWAPLIDAYFTSSLPSMGFAALDVPQALRLVGADILERHSPAVRSREASYVERRVEERGDTRRHIVKTPAGELSTEITVSQTAKTSYTSKHPIGSIEDVKVYQSLVEHTSHEPAYEEFRERMRAIGEDGIPSCSGPMSPIQLFLQHLAGVQTTVYLLAEHPDEMQACFDAMHERNKQVYRLMSQSPTEVIIDYEDTSSTVISPGFYAEYCAPLIDEYADICHREGKLYLTHMCGKLSVFSPQLRRGRQDGIDSVCPPTTGDIWAHEARAAWGEEKVIVGGIEPPALARMTAIQCEQYARRVIEQMPTLRGFILSTGDATPYATPVENLQAISRVARDYPVR